MKRSFFPIALCSLLSLISCSKENMVQKNHYHVNRQLITIPNGDFENWTPGLLPSDWSTNSCPFCLPAYETYIVQKDGMAYHRQFAAKFIFNNVYVSHAENKFPVPYHPSQLTTYVKCNVVTGDSVWIKIRIFHNSQVKDSGQWLGINSINNYTPIVIHITQSSALADTAIIYIRSGQKVNAPNPDTEFWVDNLNLK